MSTESSAQALAPGTQVDPPVAAKSLASLVFSDEAVRGTSFSCKGLSSAPPDPPLMVFPIASGVLEEAPHSCLPSPTWSSQEEEFRHGAEDSGKSKII